MQFEIDKKTIWEDTGKIIVHNFPPSNKTFSYITRVYRENKKGVLGWKDVEGEPIYFNDLPQEQQALAIIIGNAQNVLSNVLEREKYLKVVRNGS